jgi:hypothetical protein
VNRFRTSSRTATIGPKAKSVAADSTPIMVTLRAQVVKGSSNVFQDLRTLEESPDRYKSEGSAVSLPDKYRRRSDGDPSPLPLPGTPSCLLSLPAVHRHVGDSQPGSMMGTFWDTLTLDVRT